MIAAKSMEAEAPGPAIANRETPLGAADQEIQQILRAARADVALLGLRLRTALRQAEDAEGQVREANAEGDEVDLAGARELQQQTLRRWIESRRRELAQEVERARRDAEEMVVEARRDALDRTLRACDDGRRLLAGAETRAPEPDLAPPPPSQPDDAFRSRDSAAAPGAAPAEWSPAPTPKSLPEEAGVPDSVTSARLVAEPRLVDQTERPLYEWAPPADHERWFAPPPDPPPPTTLATPAVAQKGRRPTVQRNEEPTVAERRSWTAFLYLDVVLPLIAVVIVVVVLLAWIG